MINCSSQYNTLYKSLQLAIVTKNKGKYTVSAKCNFSYRVQIKQIKVCHNFCQERS